ncbi:MAG: pyridoxamine 5'-phosphate oxidase, partial [Pseudomonadales bacterium]|nr:pyridoxamine 5'-phosphate oxidase [Pseudomonadales bacterium]
SARQVLEAQLESMRQKFSHGEIPMPDFWGGYRIRPHEWEFWQGGENRLHDRFQYLPGSGSGSWEISRLAP